ncbi:MAG: GAF domain-containing SpoIIE family protein phosphatase [Pseudomonadota bacterium]
MDNQSLAGSLLKDTAYSNEGLAGLLADVTHEFASSLNIEETLQNAIDQIIVYLNAEAASIFLLEEDQQAIVCRKCAGPVDITGLQLRPDQGIVGKTIAENNAQIVRDVREDENFAAAVDADTGFETRSIMCAPLTVRGQCIGALELINKRSGDRLFAASDMHLATAVSSAAALAIHNARMAQALVEQERVRRELELARQIQESLLPTPGEAEFPIHGINIPAREVSGDFYDFCAVSDNRIYFSLADVSGKGMNAALLMAKTTSLLRCLAKTETDPGALLTKVNREICETASMGMFVTIVVGYVNTQSGAVHFTNAGHQPPLQWLGNGEYAEFAASEPPVGIVADLEFTTQAMTLADGPLYLFTDGLSEARDSEGEELGVDGLCEIVTDCETYPAKERLAEIVKRLTAMDRQINDDVTMLVIEE